MSTRKQVETIQTPTSKIVDLVTEWRSVTLDDCMEAIIDYRGKTPAKTTSGIPLITAKIVKGGRIAPPEEFIAEQDYEAWMRRGMPQMGDVVITTEAPLGEVAQLGPGRIALAQRLIALRGKRGLLDNTFLKFMLQSAYVQDQLAGRASGTTVLGIKQSELRKLVLRVPPIDEQVVIAKVLGALDDKIETNRRMSETLEEMARALFKSWFVDFDPVRAKAEGRPTGLPDDIAALFPDSFEASELGEIPRGWKYAALKKHVELNPLRSLKRSVRAPYLDMANVPTQGHSPASVIEREFGSGMKFENGDTLLARITPCLENGKTAFVDFLAEHQVGWGSTEFIVLHPIAPLPPEYGYCLARSPEFRQFAIQSMTGTSGRQRVQADSLARFQIAVPCEQVAVAFGRFASQLFARIKASNQESKTLAAIRDALLPKLISGEIRVKG